MNEYGLTFRQWLAAATFGTPASRITTSRRKLRAAWRAGECPCDWAAYHARTPA